MGCNPYSAYVDALADDEFSLLKQAVDERDCRELVGVGTLVEAADKYRAHPSCPECGYTKCPKDGRSSTGLQRHKCPKCKTRFVSTSGSVLEYCKKPLSTWVYFIRLLTYGMSLEGCADLCNITVQTAFEWRHRVFATVEGYQNRVKLSGRVWIDEMYVSDSELEKGPDGELLRGLSRQKLCIAVAIDEHKNTMAKVCGHGKPSAKRLKAAFAGHIGKDATIIHDKERSHISLIKDIGCQDEAYKANIKDPVYLLNMKLINSLCSWLRRYLRRYVGMKPSNLQDYLNWYIYLFRVNRDRDRWPKIERVVRHLLMADAYYRSSR